MCNVPSCIAVVTYYRTSFTTSMCGLWLFRLNSLSEIRGVVTTYLPMSNWVLVY